MQDETFVSAGRFFKGNIHTHSNKSDGVMSPTEVVSLYRKAKYDFVAITDHFTQKYGYPITDTKGFRSSEFTTIIGAELHAPATSIGEKWHILALGLRQDFEPPQNDETAVALARRAASFGAFIAIAHPAWYGLSLEDMQSIDVAHAIEIYNHRSAVLTARGDSTCHADQLHSQGRKIGVIAVDDAHFNTDDSLGGFVMVKSERNTPDALLESLKAQRFYASQGPAIRHVQWNKNDVNIKCSPASVVMVVSKGSSAAYETGHEITEVTLSLTRVLKHGYGRVVVMDNQGRRAWTNPVWW